MADIQQSNKWGFSKIHIPSHVAKDEHLDALLARFERFCESIGAANDAFTFDSNYELTVDAEELGFAGGDQHNVYVTPKSTEADIAFLWGVMASRENERLARALLYSVISPNDSGPILNRRWGMIEKSIETMVGGILKSAEEHCASKEDLAHLNEVISEIAWSKKNSEAMLMSRPLERVIPQLSRAYSKATNDTLSADSAMAITALLSMRNECLEWMFTTHKHNKTITSPTDYLFRISESERVSGDEVSQVYDFAVGGLMSYRAYLATGSVSNLSERFLPTASEYAAIKDKLDAVLDGISKKEIIEKTVRRFQ